MIVGHARFVSAGLYSYTSGANSQFQRLGEQIISGSSAAEQNVGGGTEAAGCAGKSYRRRDD